MLPDWIELCRLFAARSVDFLLIEAVKGFIAYVRTPEGKRDLARAEFERFWDDWKKKAPDISEEEAEELAREAVAFARGRA